MASDYLLELDGIKGESSDDKHKDAIEISSFSWGESNPSSIGHGGGGGAGKVTFQDFHFVKKEDIASPKLFLACAQGQHIKKATLFVREAARQSRDLMKIELENILVSSFQQAGDGGVPTDQFSLNFAKITYTHFSQRAEGTVAPVIATWDLANNRDG